MMSRGVWVQIIVLVFIHGVCFGQSDAASYGDYADGLVASGDYDRALKYYSYAVKVDRGYWKGWLGIGRCYEGKSDKENARKYYAHALSLSPGNAEISAALAGLDSLSGVGVAADTAPAAVVGEEPMSEETTVQGERARERHKLTICSAFLTPIIMGIDIGYNINYKMNIGLGVGYVYYGKSFEPRFKYFLSEGEHSTFIGFGVGIIRGGIKDSGSYSGWEYEYSWYSEDSFSVLFPNFKIGLSRQGYGGLLFEFEFDIGYAKASFKDVYTDTEYDWFTGEPETVTYTDEDAGGYPIVWIGMRIGFCI